MICFSCYAIAIVPLPPQEQAPWQPQPAQGEVFCFKRHPTVNVKFINI